MQRWFYRSIEVIGYFQRGTKGKTQRSRVGELPTGAHATLQRRSHLYIPGSIHIFHAQADLSWEYINRSQTHECGNWNCGRAFPFLGIILGCPGREASRTHGGRRLTFLAANRPPPQGGCVGFIFDLKSRREGAQPQIWRVTLSSVDMRECPVTLCPHLSYFTAKTTKANRRRSYNIKAYNGLNIHFMG